MDVLHLKFERDFNIVTLIFTQERHLELTGILETAGSVCLVSHSALLIPLLTDHSVPQVFTTPR